MKKTIALILALVGAISLAQGQDFIFDPDKKGKTDVEFYAEGEGKEKKQLLLISYKPVMHIPDPAGDMELLMASGKDLNRLYNRIRQGLDVSMAEKFREGFVVTSLLRTNDSTKHDLNTIYGAAGYDYDERPVDINDSKGFGRLCCPDILGSTVKKPSRDVETKISGGQISSRDIDRSSQYMNVSIPDTNLITYLTSRYNADILVFVNQFELKKKFSKGEDVAYGKYSREVKVHYSVFDRSGVQLYGNTSTGQVDEKHDNINEIISMTFPGISSDVYDHIPGSHNPETRGNLDKRNQKKAENQEILRKD